jgi:parallel beta-helix repeat protein
MKAAGTKSKNIIFTSIHDDSASGDSNNNGTASTPGTSDWYGIEYSGTASDVDNILKNCEIRYLTNYYYSGRGAVRINSCRVVMDSTKVNFTNTTALGIMGDANPQISNCQFYNLADAPIYMDAFASPVFSGNNKLANLPYIGIRLHGQEIKGTFPIRSFAGYDTISYILDEEMTVREQLTIPAGLSFKGSGIWHIRGKLNINGTAQKPVIFTTMEDDAYGNPKDMQQNGNSALNNYGNTIIFYDEANDTSLINNAKFRYSYRIPIQITNASPSIQNCTFENGPYEGISLSGSSKPKIDNCTFNNIPFPFTTSLVTYPASTSGNTITGTTGRAIRVTNETLTNDVILTKKSLAGIANIPYVFQNYTVGTGAKLTINPGVVCKFMQNGGMTIQNGLIALGGGTTDSTIVFTSDRDDFYGGDTYADGDANQPSNNYWYGIYFNNEAIDDNCILKNCVLKNGSWFYYNGYTGNRGAITMNNASPTIQSCLFKNDYYGIVALNTSLPKISNCDFVGTDPTNGYGVWNQNATSTVTAKGCWWNSNTGPRHSSNPAGVGERVSDYVTFTPFALQLAKPVLGDVSLNGTITPFDASMVLQHTVSTIVLTTKQKGVADVSGNGTITSYDASLILQYCVGLISRFTPGSLKSAISEDPASVLFSDVSALQGTNTISVPVMLSTQSSIKSLEMKYLFDQKHIKFLRINSGELPVGLSVESGYNQDKGQIALSIASAYDLELNNAKVILEFEVIDPSYDQSTVSLESALANEYILGNTPVAVNFSTKDIMLGTDFRQAGSGPEIYFAGQTLYVKFNTQKADQEADIQLVDQSGKIIFRRTLKGLGVGFHSFEFPVSESGKTAGGIYITSLRSGDSIYSKKLLIK